MSSIEFFFDPMCPFAWITSRWIHEVAGQRDLDVRWRFISLAEVNREQFEADEEAIAAGREPKLPRQYRPLTAAGNKLLRIAAVLDDAKGNQAVADFYTAAGELLHTGGRSKDLWQGGDPDQLVADVVAAAGVDDATVEASEDPQWAKVVREDTDLALSRTGKDVGTPIITFDLERPDEASLFGPVISRIPRGDEAVRLWDAIEVVARTPGIAEFKRSQRAELDFS